MYLNTIHAYSAASTHLSHPSVDVHDYLLMRLYGRAPTCPLCKRDHCIGLRIGYASGMHRCTHQVITLSVRLGEGGFGAHPHTSKS